MWRTPRVDTQGHKEMTTYLQDIHSHSLSLSHTHTGPDCVVMCNLINTHTHTHTHEPTKHEDFCISARRTSRLVWSVVAADCCLGFLSTHTRKITKLFSLTRAQKDRPSNARTPLPRKLLHQGNQELGRSVAGKGSTSSRSALSSQTQQGQRTRASGVLAGREREKVRSR